MLKWAREWVSLPDFVCTSAAYYRNVEILEWIRENGGQWDKHTIVAAADGGHLEALKWLREQGCPLDRALVSNAAKKHPNIHKWLKEEGLID